MSIWTRTFWQAALERAIRATAWAAAGTLGTGATGLLDTDWRGIASVAAMAGVLSLLVAVGTGAATGTGPSITSAETLANTVAVTAPADAQVDVDVSPPSQTPDTYYMGPGLKYDAASGRIERADEAD